MIALAARRFFPSYPCARLRPAARPLMVFLLPQRPYSHIAFHLSDVHDLSPAVAAPMHLFPTQLDAISNEHLAGQGFDVVVTE